MKNIFDILRRTNSSAADSARLYGQFGLTVYEHGKKTLSITKRNQVTNGGRRIVLELLRQSATIGWLPQANPNYNQIWSLGAGTNATPPAATDTDLYSVAWTGQLIGDAEIYVQDIPTLEILISKVMPEADGVGVTFQEAGLYTRGSLDDPSTLFPPTDWSLIPFRRLYARQAHPAILKSAVMSLEYSWRLGITV